MEARHSRSIVSVAAVGGLLIVATLLACVPVEESRRLDLQPRSEVTSQDQSKPQDLSKSRQGVESDESESSSATAQR